MKPRHGLRSITVLAALFSACGTSAPPTDAGGSDATATDSAATDAASSIDASSSSCTNPIATRWVTVAHWMTSDCSGTPIATQRYPIDFGSTACYCCSGRSGMNSAKNSTCNTGASEFSFEQWTNFVCGDGSGMPGVRKTLSTTRCTQDVPPTLYGRITDYSGCM